MGPYFADGSEWIYKESPLQTHPRGSQDLLWSIPWNKEPLQTRSACQTQRSLAQNNEYLDLPSTLDPSFWDRGHQGHYFGYFGGPDVNKQQSEAERRHTGLSQAIRYGATSAHPCLARSLSQATDRPKLRQRPLRTPLKHPLNWSVYSFSTGIWKDRPEACSCKHRLLGFLESLPVESCACKWR